MAVQAFAPPMESFRSGRDFAAWLGLVPRQSSTGGKARLGKISATPEAAPSVSVNWRKTSSRLPRSAEAFSDSRVVGKFEK